MIYSRVLVKTISFCIMKLKGAIALYRIRALIPGIGKYSRCPLNVEIKIPEKVIIGDHVSIGPMSTLGGYGGIILEDYVRISKGVTIESAGLDLSGSLPYQHTGKPVRIKRGAWLGTRCMILGGVTIGEQAVIGAGAIISKDVPDGAIIVGSSTRVVGQVCGR